MVQIQYSLIKKFHPYHLVDPSPWPYLLATNILLMSIGATLFLHTSIKIILFLAIIMVCVIFFLWIRDIIRESTFQGKYTLKVLNGLRIGFLLFIISEIFFFISFFWAFFHSSLSPAIEIGSIWPPFGIQPINVFSIPLLNTALLLSSGFTITWCHFNIKRNHNSRLSLFITILLGLIFTSFQIFEYFESPFSMADSVYGSCFFLLTGFHGFHVIVGTIFLLISFYRLSNFHFTNTRHFGLEAASWYWHFVDVVWIFLFLVLYWWGN